MFHWIGLLLALSFVPGDAADDLPPITNSREMLAARGLDSMKLGQFTDGQALADTETELLRRTLLVIGKLDFLDIRLWTTPNVSWVTWAREPAAHRGEVIDIRGRVKRVTLEKLPPAEAERFPFEHYYRCELLVGDEADPAIVYALKIPKAWKLNEPIDERAGARGFFLKLGGAKPEPQTPIFAAKRVAWYANTELGELGMDVGLFDDVVNRKPMLPQENECFYELLSAVGRANGKELRQRTKDKQFSVVPLFNEPDQQFGKLVSLLGTANRAVLVRLSDANLIESYGIDHYYEVEMFTGDSQRNPIAFCVHELPEGMPTGENIQVDLRIAGFYYKSWAYRIKPGEAEGDHKTKPQLAPLLVGRDLVFLVSPPKDQTAEILKGFGFLAVLAAIVGAAWWLNRGDRKFRNRTLGKKYVPENDRALNDIGKGS